MHSSHSEIRILMLETIQIFCDPVSVTEPSDGFSWNSGVLHSKFASVSFLKISSMIGVIYQRV